MTTLDPERQQQAKQYARIRRRLWLVSNALSAVYALAWLFTGWAINLCAWLTTISPNPWIPGCWLCCRFWWHLRSRYAPA